MARPKKIAVLIESHFDPTEPGAFLNFFPVRGYEIEFVSDLRGAQEATFYDNDNSSKTITVTKDIKNVVLLDYTGLLCVGGYAMDMLRYDFKVTKGENGRPKSIPAASQFAVDALRDPEITVGTICHSLWIFTPEPSALAGRIVTCGHNILYDVLNAGGVLDFGGQFDQLAAVTVDRNLVTGRHPYTVQEFMEAYMNELEKKV